MKGSGAEVPGTTYQCGEMTVNAGAITTFAKYAVISENRVTRLMDLGMKEAATLGCAIATGVGAVFNTARAERGQSLAVFGVGGIGLCAVAGAAIRGCRPIIAVDVVPDKLDRARRMGATHVVDARTTDPVGEITRLVGGGVDVAIDASGRPQAMKQALETVRKQGGTAVIVGNAKHGEVLQLDPAQLNMGKRLLGSWGGDNIPDRDFPVYAGFLKSGDLNLEPLLSHIYPLHQINPALDDLEAGRVGRSLIDLSLS
jgi:S-(hydroxymethyl)glutathione dehydrogenase/alcohol dehydrogenase